MHIVVMFALGKLLTKIESFLLLVSSHSEKG